MEYLCEDLPRYGVVLLPPSSPDYAGLLADIQNRLAKPVPGSAPQLPDSEDPSAPTMILCNRSQTAIAAVSWIWKFELDTGRSTRSSAAGVPSLLAPFGLDERVRKLYGYWQVVLPGSKRGIRGSSMFGDNTDVRPPQPDELWTGGGFGVGGGSRGPLGPLKSVTLVLDGVFFLDGGFAGPDTLNNFDRLTAQVDAYLQVAKIARDGHNRGLTPATIFAQIEVVTGPVRGPAPPPPPEPPPPGTIVKQIEIVAGPAPPPPGGPAPAPPPGGRGNFHQDKLRNLTMQIAMMRRQGMGDDQVVYSLMSWTETPLPSFHKL
jgi:hypothetical protein